MIIIKLSLLNLIIIVTISPSCWIYLYYKLYFLFNFLKFKKIINLHSNLNVKCPPKMLKKKPMPNDATFFPLANFSNNMEGRFVLMVVFFFSFILIIFYLIAMEVCFFQCRCKFFDDFGCLSPLVYSKVQSPFIFIFNVGVSSITLFVIKKIIMSRIM